MTALALAALSGAIVAFAFGLSPEWQMVFASVACAGMGAFFGGAKA